MRAGVYEGEWFDTGTLDSFLEASAYLMKNGAQVGAGASVNGELGSAVSVGASASVECRSIEDSVVLGGSRVRCSGDIRHSILCGDVQSDGDLIGGVAYGDERA